MALIIIFSDKAKKDFEGIRKGDKNTAVRIAETIKQYATNSIGNYDVKKTIRKVWQHYAFANR